MIINLAEKHAITFFKHSYQTYKKQLTFLFIRTLGYIQHHSFKNKSMER